MKKHMKLVRVLGGLSLAGLLATSLAANVPIANPKVGKHALDYCKIWGEECGHLAAEAYCRKNGYDGAAEFKVQHNSPPTRVISTGAICDQPHCDRISHVVCISRSRTFSNPQVNGYALDLCRTWGEGCGQPAADAFCVANGYRRASDYSEQQNNPPTRLLSTNAICDQPYCDRITRVVCER